MHTYGVRDPHIRRRRCQCCCGWPWHSPTTPVKATEPRARTQWVHLARARERRRPRVRFASRCTSTLQTAPIPTGVAQVGRQCETASACDAVPIPWANHHRHQEHHRSAWQIVHPVQCASPRRANGSLAAASKRHVCWQAKR